jgi:ribosomal protein S2
MDAQITKIRERYQDHLKDCAEKKEAAFDLIRSYVSENKDVLFVSKKKCGNASRHFRVQNRLAKIENP